MYGDVVHSIDGEGFERCIEAVKKSQGVSMDVELTAESLKELVEQFKVTGACKIQAGAASGSQP